MKNKNRRLLKDKSKKREKSLGLMNQNNKRKRSLRCKRNNNHQSFRLKLLLQQENLKISKAKDPEGLPDDHLLKRNKHQLKRHHLLSRAPESLNSHLAERVI